MNKTLFKGIVSIISVTMAVGLSMATPLAFADDAALTTVTAPATPSTSGSNSISTQPSTEASAPSAPSTSGSDSISIPATSTTSQTAPPAPATSGSNSISTTTTSESSTGAPAVPSTSGSNSISTTTSTTSAGTGTTGGTTGGISFSGGGAVGGGSQFYSGSSTLASTTVSATSTSVAINGLGTSGHFACPLITSYIFQNQANDPAEVNKLQAFLKIEGGSPSLAITGVYDAQTIAAVDAFQTANLSTIMGPWGATQASGQVYITTTKRINEIACDTTIPLTASDLAIINAYKANLANGGTIGSGTDLNSILGATSTNSNNSGGIGDSGTLNTSALTANVTTNGLADIGHFFARIFTRIAHFFGKK